jgi:glucose/arabinose dehydrogenase/mono/diheme cytochrome c family protein
MHSRRAPGNLRSSLILSSLVLASAPMWLTGSAAATPGAPRHAVRSCTNDTGLTLPQGFCATVFADQLGHARHLVVAPSGVVYVNTRLGRRDSSSPSDGGFLVALEDTNGAGVANVIRRFGETADEGGKGGTGIAFYRNAVYAEINDRIDRYPLASGSIVPEGAPEVIVSGLPLTGDHPMHGMVIDPDGALYVEMGSATNACQKRNRKEHSPGLQPCTELETRGGIWRYDANKLNQKFSPAERYATGIRNPEGLALDAGGHALYATQHGRDQLHANWPELYKPEEEATQPAEELLRIAPGGDYGWPECYFDEIQGKLVLAPEYGGDGGKTVGVCATKQPPIASFPAHWAPNALVIYTARSFPARYRGGAFIAFHGSWDRAPYPQGGYNVVYQPLRGDARTDRSQCEVFADGFAGSVRQPGSAEHRPSGVAVGPDGALYVSDDVRGTIYRIIYGGGRAADGVRAFTPCPPVDAAAGSLAAAGEEGRAPAVSLPVPPGSSRAAVELGEQIYHGQPGGAACVACHGTDGAGTSLGPKLTGPTWLWSDGGYAALEKTIAAGVPKPKQFTEPMPPMGGTQLTSEQLSALAAYVWALGHPTH